MVRTCGGPSLAARPFDTRGTALRPWDQPARKGETLSTPDSTPPAGEPGEPAAPTPPPYTAPAYAPPPAYTPPPAGAPYSAPPAQPQQSAQSTQPAPPPYAPPAAPAPYGQSAEQPAYAAPAYPPAPPAYGQAPYGQAPYAGAYGYAEQKTNVLAILSLVGSILGIIGVLPLIGSIAGTVLGHISLRQIPKTGEKGRGLALAGTIVGWVGIGLAALLILLFVIIWVSSVSTLTTTY